MFRAIVFSIFCFTCIGVYASEEAGCDLSKHDLSAFLEKREGLEKSFVQSAHDLMIEYCGGREGANSLVKVFTTNGLTDKNTGVEVLLNAVNVVGPFYRGRSDVDNKEVFARLLKFYQAKYKNAATAEEQKILAASFSMTSKATVEIINYFVTSR